MWDIIAVLIYQIHYLGGLKMRHLFSWLTFLYENSIDILDTNAYNCVINTEEAQYGRR